MSFFDNRQVISAEDLRGPRVYSTDLLPSLYAAGPRPETVAVIGRALKIKIITKGLVTLNCAYLVSPLAVDLMDAYPDLLDGQSILPAFRRDKENLSDLVQSSRGAGSVEAARLRDHIARIDGSVRQVMPWDLGEVANEFRRKILEGLRNPDSTIARELKAQVGWTDRELASVARDVETMNLNDSANLRAYLEQQPEAARLLLNQFQTACYHSVGTTVVKCETGADLHPLSSFKAADMVLAGRDASEQQLSDETIFMDAFMGLALEAIHASFKVPAQIIDTIEFPIVHRLGAVLREQGFQERYEDIVQKYLRAKRGQTKEECLDSLDEEAITGTAAELATEFKRAIDGELGLYRLRIQEEAKTDLIRAGTDVFHDAAVGVAGLFPGVGAIVSYAEATGHAGEAINAAERVRTLSDQQAAFAEADARKVERINHAIDHLKASSSKKAKLLEGVALLSDISDIQIARA